MSAKNMQPSRGLNYAAKQLNSVRARIHSACKKYGRSPSNVSLVGASKQQSTELISDFISAGLSHLGENYLQEAQEKQQALTDREAAWHFIGSIQSRKAATIAEHFDWVHGVDRLKVANRLKSSRQNKVPLNVLIQLNLDDEDSKAGLMADEALELATHIQTLDQLCLRGFMLIPQPRDSFEQQRAVFAKARELLLEYNQATGSQLDQLSMGMSSDLEAAIAEGSTMVRVGTDLFGTRPSK